jgi:hypothetical protein
MLSVFCYYYSPSLLRASILLVKAAPCVLFAKYNSLSRIIAPIVQMGNHSGVPHGGIYDEELIVKDGMTYYHFSGVLNHVQEDIKYHKHKRRSF